MPRHASISRRIAVLVPLSAGAITNASLAIATNAATGYTTDPTVTLIGRDGVSGVFEAAELYAERTIINASAVPVASCDTASTPAPVLNARRQLVPGSGSGDTVGCPPPPPPPPALTLFFKDKCVSYAGSDRGGSPTCQCYANRGLFASCWPR